MKKYLDLFRDSAEEQYQSGRYPLMALSARLLQTNKIRFTPIEGQYDDGTVGTLEYAIQRFKRIKEGDQQNAHADKAGSDYIATLDQAQSVDWETVTTKRSAQKQLLVSVKKGEGTNALADATRYNATISNRSENKLISKEERAVEKVLAASTEIDITAAITAGTTVDEKREAFCDAFVDAGDSVNALVDEFKYNATPIVIYNPRIGKIFSKIQGQAYQTGTNTFGDAFKAGFNYNDLDFLPEDVFKSIAKIGAAGDDTDKVVLGIVMANDAYADSGLETGMIEVNESLVRQDVIGHIYDDLSAIVDTARIFKITATIASLKAIGLFKSGYKVEKKVNAA